MQTNHLDIYKQLAQEKGKSEQMYKDLGSFIFKETSRLLKNPSSLILKLKGIGSWHLRKKRMEILISEWPEREKVRTREEFGSDSGYDQYMEKHRLFKVFKERLVEYEQYLTQKAEVRKKRNETQTLVEGDKGENIRFKSS